jgi:hypothetical protein
MAHNVSQGWPGQAERTKSNRRLFRTLHKGNAFA